MSVQGTSGNFFPTDGMHIARAANISENRKVSEEVLLCGNASKQRNHRFSHSVGLLAGIVVLIVALAVAAVAFTLIAPGVPQGIVLAITLTGVSIGGFSVMKGIVNKVKDRFAPKLSKRQLAKTSMAVGTGFAGIGLALKCGSSLMPGGVGKVVGSIASSAYNKGFQSATVGFAHYIYLKHFASDRVKNGEILSQYETLTEAKKLKRISLGITVLGVGLLALGIALSVVGTIALGGWPATVLLIFAQPLIGIGTSVILQNLLHSCIGIWKTFLEAQRNGDIFVDFGLGNIRKEEDNSVSDHVITRLLEEKSANESLAVASEEAKNRIAFTKRQKIILGLLGLFFISGLAAILISGFGSLPTLQVLLLSSLGSSVATTVLPMLSSGLVNAMLQLKYRLRVSRWRWMEAKAKVQAALLLSESDLSIHQIDEAWNHTKSMLVFNTNLAIQKEIIAYEKGRELQHALLSGIFIFAGLGIILLTLVPGLVPISAGILAVGGALLGIGGGIMMKKLVTSLQRQLGKIWEKKEERTNLFRRAEEELGVCPEDLVVDVSSLNFMEDFSAEDSENLA